MWVLQSAEFVWYLSTEELAKDTAEFFHLSEDDYEIYEYNNNDDEEVIRRFKTHHFKPEKYH